MLVQSYSFSAKSPHYYATSLKSNFDKMNVGPISVPLPSSFPRMTQPIPNNPFTEKHHDKYYPNEFFSVTSKKNL